MSTTLTVLIVVTAIVVTYFSCVRPMSRGRSTKRTTGDAELDRQIADLREELRVLRAKDTPDRPPST